MKKFTAPSCLENPSLGGSRMILGHSYTTYESSRDDNKAAGEKGRENEHRCLFTVGWGSSCSWRWIDSKAAAKRPTLLCVFFRPLPFVPAPCFSSRESSPPPPACYSPLTTLRTPCLPLPSRGSIAPERFTDVSRKISTTGSYLRALRFNWRWLFSRLSSPLLFTLHPLVPYERWESETQDQDWPFGHRWTVP